jgi:hypothetical protein
MFSDSVRYKTTGSSLGKMVLKLFTTVVAIEREILHLGFTFLIGLMHDLPSCSRYISSSLVIWYR